MTKKKRLLVFNSGGGSGFQELVENTHTGVLQAEVVGLVTNKASYVCVDMSYAKSSTIKCIFLTQQKVHLLNFFTKLLQFIYCCHKYIGYEMPIFLASFFV